MMELDDRTNYYRRQLAQFKKKQQKWLRQQKAMLKNKKEGVKYVFIDDMVSVKINSKYKDRVKVVNKKGKEILVEKIKVVHEKGKKKKAKKKGGKDNNFVDDDPSWLQQDEIVQQLLDDIEKDGDYESSFFQTEATSFGLDDVSDDDDEDFDDLQVIRGDVMEWKEEMAKRNEDMSILMSIALNSNRDGDKSNLNFDDLMQGIVERNQERFEEIDDEEFDQDLDDEDGVRRKRGNDDESDQDDEDDMKSPRKRKNHYDESMKLLKSNCEEYVTSLQNAITNIQTIVETNNTAKHKPKKSILISKADAAPLLTPSAAEELSNFADDTMVLSNPDMLGEEISAVFLQELDSRSKDIQLMHEIFYSQYSNDDKQTLTNLEDIVKSIDDRIDDIEDDESKLVGNIQEWKLQFQELVIREAMLMRELTERRDEIKQIFDVIDISGGANKALANRLSTLSGGIDNRHKNVTTIIDTAKYETILGDDSKRGDNDDDDGYNTDAELDPEQEDNHSNATADFMQILENFSGFHRENEEYRRFMGKLKAVKYLTTTCLLYFDISITLHISIHITSVA